MSKSETQKPNFNGMIEPFFILMSLRIFSLLPQVRFDVALHDGVFSICSVLKFLRSRVGESPGSLL